MNRQPSNIPIRNSLSFELVIELSKSSERASAYVFSSVMDCFLFIEHRMYFVRIDSLMVTLLFQGSSIYAWLVGSLPMNVVFFRNLFVKEINSFSGINGKRNRPSANLLIGVTISRTTSMAHESFNWLRILM